MDGCLKFLLGVGVLGALFGVVVYQAMPKRPVQQAKVVAPAKPAPKVDVQKIDKSDAMQAGREKLIQKLINEGVFLKVEVPGSLPRVFVTPAFHALDIETKEKFVSVVYAFYFSDHSIRNVVRVMDSRTGKEVGTFSALNPGLKMH